MAQGKMKQKVKLPQGAKQRGSHDKKKLGPRKGGKIIKPKKARHIETLRSCKEVSKLINAKVHKEIVGAAAGTEAKSFSIVNNSTPGQSKTTSK